MGVKKLENYPLMLGANHLMEIFGLSRNPVYALLRRDDFPSIRVGGRIVVSRDLLVKWIEENAGKVV